MPYAQCRKARLGSVVVPDNPLSPERLHIRGACRGPAYGNCAAPAHAHCGGCADDCPYAERFDKPFYTRAVSGSFPRTDPVG